MARQKIQKTGSKRCFNLAHQESYLKIIDSLLPLYSWRGRREVYSLDKFEGVYFQSFMNRSADTMVESLFFIDHT